MPGPVSDTAPQLNDRMRALAATGHPRAAELIDHAEKIEALNVTSGVMSLLGTWARARKVWCEITGEPLI